MKICVYWVDVPVNITLFNEVILNHNFLSIYTNNINEHMKETLEQYLDLDIRTINLERSSEIFEEQYDLFLISGWSDKISSKILSYCEKNNKNYILMLDNILSKHLIINLLKKFKFFYHKRYLANAFFVPGELSEKYLNFMGVERNKVYKGLYGANEKIFNSKGLSEEKDRIGFLFVGQLIRRKSIRKIILAYRKYRSEGGTWPLNILGKGTLKISDYNFEGIKFHGQLTPSNVAIHMKNNYCLVLLSKSEHWGTVVIEAMACGMAVILSENIGSIPDVFNQNGEIINRVSLKSISSCFWNISNLDREKRLFYARSSYNMSEFYNTHNFHINFQKLIALFDTKE